MTILPLQDGIMYGPIKSRRLGKSLGVNLMPVAYKLCPFNCVYCHYGWTQAHDSDVTPYVQDLPPFGDVVAEIERAFVSDMDFNYITFSGNGEPTLYPSFTALVDAVIDLRYRHRPNVKIALLSNSAGLLTQELHPAINRLDLPVFKLDAGTEKDFVAINRPTREITLKKIVEALAMLRNIYLQTVIIDGEPCNTNDRQLSAYHDLIKRIKPKEVHIYSIDRPVPNKRIIRVLPERLEAIAKTARQETGVPFRTFHM